jgi:phage terminase small subunit
LNGAAAAVRTGCSPKTADRQAYALLRRPEISKIVGAAEKQRLEANKVSATRVIEENRRIGFNDPRRFIDASGNLKPITEWTEEMAASVASIEVVRKNVTTGDGHTDTVVKLRFRQPSTRSARHSGFAKSERCSTRSPEPLEIWRIC